MSLTNCEGFIIRILKLLAQASLFLLFSLRAQCKRAVMERRDSYLQGEPKVFVQL